MTEQKTYFKCECGSDTFVRMYSVYNELIKVVVITENDEEFWDTEELGIEKHHKEGYICAKCRQDAQELNDGL